MVVLNLTAGDEPMETEPSPAPTMDPREAKKKREEEQEKQEEQARYDALSEDQKKVTIDVLMDRNVKKSIYSSASF